jgi:hypothetical protein
MEMRVAQKLQQESLGAGRLVRQAVRSGSGLIYLKNEEWVGIRRASR